MSESLKKEANLWQSYDMKYNLSKYKVGEEFLQVADADLEPTENPTGVPLD